MTLPLRLGSGQKVWTHPKDPECEAAVRATLSAGGFPEPTAAGVWCRAFWGPTRNEWRARWFGNVGERTIEIQEKR